MPLFPISLPNHFWKTGRTIFAVGVADKLRAATGTHSINQNVFGVFFRTFRAIPAFIFVGKVNLAAVFTNTLPHDVTLQIEIKFRAENVHERFIQFQITGQKLFIGAGRKFAVNLFPNVIVH